MSMPVFRSLALRFHSRGSKNGAAVNSGSGLPHMFSSSPGNHSGGISHGVATLTGMPPPKDELQLRFLAVPNLLKHQI